MSHPLLEHRAAADVECGPCEYRCVNVYLYVCVFVLCDIMLGGCEICDVSIDDKDDQDTPKATTTAASNQRNDTQRRRNDDYY